MRLALTVVLVRSALGAIPTVWVPKSGPWRISGPGRLQALEVNLLAWLQATSANGWMSLAMALPFSIWECLNFCVRSTERLVHGGGRRFGTNDRRGGQVGATSYVAAFVKRSS